MRLIRYVVALLVLFGSRVVPVEVAVATTPREKAAPDSEVLSAGGESAVLDRPRELQGGDGRRLGLDGASGVAGRWPNPPAPKLPSPASTAVDKEGPGNSAAVSGGEGRGVGGSGARGGGEVGGRSFGGRRSRQSEAATFFNSLDENADGVLAENEIREFVGYVGGSSLDDNAEILGGVSSVMGRLDTDSEKGIGLKELSSWINRLGSMLTVEEAADWVTHAVQLPSEVAEAFRTNSISAYDFPQLVEDDGAALHDLGIKRKFRKRIVKAIEVRLLGLGDEPPRPVLHAPSYLGQGKVRVEWSAGGIVSGGHDNSDKPDDRSGSSTAASQAAEPPPPPAEAADAEAVVLVGENVGGRAATAALPATQPLLPPPPPPEPQPSRSATFPVHKYVLERSCLHSQAAASISATEGNTAAAAAAAGMVSAAMDELGGGERRFGDGTAAAAAAAAATAGIDGGGWVTVYEADDVGFIAASSSFVFVDSGLSPGKTYVYRVRAWNLIGHSEAPTAHVTTPPVPSLWTKPWRLISPWWRTGNSSAAPQDPSPSGVQASGGRARSVSMISVAEAASAEAAAGAGKEGFVGRGAGGAESMAGERGWGWWWDVLRTAWLVLSWTGRGCVGVVKLLQAVLVLATLQANLTRLHAAYGRGGTGAAVRGNWAATLVWKLNHVVARNGYVSRAIQAINDLLERAIGAPPSSAPPYPAGDRGLRRQSSTRNILGDNNNNSRRGVFVRQSSSYSRQSSSYSRHGSRDYSSGGEGDEWPGLSRIDEQEMSGVGVDNGRGRGEDEDHFFFPRNVSGGSGSGGSSGSGGGGGGGGGYVYRPPQDPPSGMAARTASSLSMVRRSRQQQQQQPQHQQSHHDVGEGRGDGGEPSPGENRLLSGGGVFYADGRDGTTAELDPGGDGSFGGDRRRQVVGDEPGGFPLDGPEFGFSDADVFFDGLLGGGDEDDDIGEVEMRPPLERSGSSLDLRRALPHLRKTSVSRLALGLKKGEASGRDAWRKEFQNAEACFSCRKPFKVTRQRHHCGRCHRVFCGKHGYTSHLAGTVCTVPGDCICAVCLESIVGGGAGVANTGEEVSPGRRRGQKAGSDRGGADGASVDSIRSEGGGRKGRKRFAWVRSTSFGQLRRRRRGTIDPFADENKEEAEESFLRSFAGGGGGGGGGGGAIRGSHPNSSSGPTARSTGRSTAGSADSTTVTPPPLPTRVASGRALTASPSADGSSPNPVPISSAAGSAHGFSYRAAAEGARDVADGDGEVGAGGDGQEGGGGVVRGRNGWGLFWDRRRITT